MPKVIFIDHVQGVAVKGDVKNVKNGYLRNYLLPRKKAIPATQGNLKNWEELRKRLLIEKEHLHAKLNEIKERLAGVKLRIEKKVTAKGTLYGGIKAADVCKAALSQFNIEIPADSVTLPSAVKAVGSFDVTIRLGEGVEAKVPMEVVEKK